MAKLSDEELRALRLLPRSPSGCTELVILDRGFTRDQIANLVFRRLARREVRNMTADGARRHGAWLANSRSHRGVDRS
jgi:hypothetical protein